MYEHRRSPLLPVRLYYIRLARHAALAGLVVLVSLGAGMAGYAYFERLGWIDAFLNSAMLLGGMGPVDAPKTPGGKLFAGCYALYAGLVFLVTGSILLALIVLCLAWELWLAPLRPGGSLVALKALPLVLAAPGILGGRRYTYQWSSMLVLAYLAEGVTRAWAERGISQSLALGEILLSVIFFAAAVSYARRTRAGA